MSRVGVTKGSQKKWYAPVWADARTTIYGLDILNDHPRLKPQLPDVLTNAFRLVVIYAA